jgi:hypothetical protein
MNLSNLFKMVFIISIYLIFKEENFIIYGLINLLEIETKPINLKVLSVLISE